MKERDVWLSSMTELPPFHALVRKLVLTGKERPLN